MRHAKRWVYGKTRGDDHYEDVEIPDRCSCHETDMGVVVVCPSCGRELPFGETYTSLEYHTPVAAWGYGVCGDCYREEMQRRCDR